MDATDLARRFGLWPGDGIVGRAERADSAAWIGEVLDEPHTRALLETILESAGPSWTAAAGAPGR
jgi:hypothetical protein